MSTQQKHYFLMKKRESLFAILTSICDKSKLLNGSNVSQFRSQFNRLTSIESDFKVVQDEIEIFNASLDDNDQEFLLDTTSVCIQTMDLVDTAKNNYLALAHALETPEQATPSGHTPTVSLPRITLPTFNGDIDEWPEFYSLFTSLVDQNPGLSAINKFQYLYSSLKGDALCTISGLKLVPENYPLALEALALRFQNKRRLANGYLQRITEFKQLTGGSQPELQRFLNVHVNSLNAFEALGIPDTWDFAKLLLSLNNLDPGSRRAFEDKHSSQTIPTYKDLIQFITERCRVAELMGKPKKTDGARKLNIEPSPLYSVRELTSETSENRRKDVGEKKEEALRENYPVSGSSTPRRKNKSLDCWNCGGNHLYANCNEPRGRFCYRCGRKGEVVSSCPSCSGNTKGRQRRGSL